MVSGVSLTRANNTAAAAAADAEIQARATASATPTASNSPVSPLTSEQTSVLTKISAYQTKTGCGLNTATVTKVAVGKCKILVIGDSLGNNLSRGMKNQLKKSKTVTLISKSKGSTGLSNSWFYNWPTEFKPMLTQNKPNLVVVMLGANDLQSMKVNGKLLSVGTTAWKKQYMEYVKKIGTMATNSGSYVLWVGLPVMKTFNGGNYARGMATLNSLYATAAPSVPGVSFVNISDYFADSKGRYRDSVRVNGKMTKVRGGDGIHFSTAGQDVLASYVVQQLSEIFKVKVSPASPKLITG
jgi:hypothetical protein